MILRLRSTKLGKVRFVGHRDVARIWDRALRRCGVPVAFTAGFTPRPRISFGLALPMGAESVAEYIDVEIDTAADDVVSHAPLIRSLSAILPDGIDVTAASRPQPPVVSLQEVVTSCTWELFGPGIDVDQVERATALLDLPTVMLERERKGQRRTDDVRPLLLDLRAGSDPAHLVADLATVGRALRPAELARLAFTHLDPLDVRVRRTHQWTNHGDVRREVLSLPTVVDALDLEVSA